MDLTKVLAELHRELDNLDAAIVSLERLEQSRLKFPVPRKSQSSRKLRDEPQSRAGSGKRHSG